MSHPLRIWHPFTQEALDPPPIRIAKAEGVYLYTDDGRRLIDGISSWWVNLHGHGHPAIMAAIAEQTCRLDHVLLAGFSHEPLEELSVGLRRVLPAQLEHIFFSDNGSTAVEVALKMSVQHWQNLGQPRKQSIVALEHAYHGDTAGAMSVSADSTFTDPFRSMRFPVHRVHSAYCYRCPVGKMRATCNIECADQLERLLEEKSGEIAAVIVEPLLQGAGGMIVHPVEFLRRVRRVCTEHNVLLIADEVLTGFGRCGKMFACELANVVPDIVCLSKGLTGGTLPMGATVCTSAIHDAFVSDGSNAHLLSWPLVHREPDRSRRGRCKPRDLRARACVRANRNDLANPRGKTRCDQRSSGGRRRASDRDRRRHRTARRRCGLHVRA